MSAILAGLQFRELHGVEQINQANALFDSIWRTGPDRPHFEPALLTAMAHAGNYVVGVYEGEEMIAACVGFFGAPAGNVLIRISLACGPITPGEASASRSSCISGNGL
ncbi:acetyltransferase, GNAT family [Renibacterium salmoninarum ATCC 33209]|uniref:Acetyltransferase, GNAT family n=1 Tax=Renibacterium salmoninarum (strain ATCC 33209 / DSM 20767 / JCM 11484 / NBRC 15589 / NCIMB 2235) TaxID=288705 RepID=A9WPT3_RENSM|nr:hypothetical protein [Renibacterium salmoninarum]ABY23054.1 acetyltransferase, GNAT family [Renibacterium salmoninarum ATCC 33209]